VRKFALTLSPAALPPASFVLTSRVLVPGVLALVLLALGVGCNGGGEMQNDTGELLPAPRGMISVYQLSERMGMTVVESSRTFATLRDSANTVMIYGDPGGQAFVNGQSVGRAGRFTPIGDTLFVPGYVITDIRYALLPAVRRREAVKPVDVPRRSVAKAAGGAKIVLDAGHGGKDPGAISPAKLQEKSVVLDTVLMMAQKLRGRGLDVVLTRGDDKFIELNERADIANRVRADLFVSIHADWIRKRATRGSTVYVARAASKKSIALGKSIERPLAAVSGKSLGVRRADYRVLVRTSCPAALVELGYLSNYHEAARLSQRAYRERLANAVCDGILAYLQSR
jgi:N-acetylmuramoyl-L-alanine amidase